MARVLTPSCKQCRREGVKLFLKGEKCSSNKCPFIKRNYPPGQHGISSARKKKSVYNDALREKQKTKKIYGILERQFRVYFGKAEKSRGITGEILLQLLERRLDNVIFRSSLAPSRSKARQLALHNHFTVNGKKVNIPSYQVRVGDKIQVKEESKKNKYFKEILPALLKSMETPSWLKVNKKSVSIEIVNLPQREDIDQIINEQLIVGFYSR